MSIIGQEQGSGASPCPSYYASAVLSWDGDHSSGTLVACDSSGNSVTFTDNSSDISTYGESSSNALRTDDNSEFISYTQTGNQYISNASAQTLCVRVYVDGPLDNTTLFMKGRYGNNAEVVALAIDTNAAIRTLGYYDWGSTATAFASAVGDTTWRTIGYTYLNPGDTDQHSTNPGDTATWADGWETDDNELTTGSNALTIISIGPDGTSSWSGDPGDTEYILIDDWAIVSGWQVDCENLFGK